MAALLRSQDAYDPIKNIREWQSQQLNVQPSDYVDETAEHNEITHLCTNLLALFREIVLTLPKITHIPKDARISLERSYSALILWSDGYGIAQGRLNDTFKKSRKLRRTVLQNLLHIGRVLIERLVPLTNISTEKLQVLCSSVESSIEETNGMISEESCRESDESSSDAGSAFSNDDIYEIAEDLKTDTRVLSGLDSLLKFPIFDPKHEDGAESYTLSTWSPEKLFSDKIENRFPCADAGLAFHLGKTNYERYLRCQAYRDAHGSEEAINATNQEGQELAGTIVAGSKFHDSGIGTSVALTMSYAETLMSYSHEGQSVRIPPLSKEAKAGLPFSCLACGRTVLITNNSAWKRHIYLDLQPYMCLDMSCPYSSTTFESREKWISHLALDHEMEPNWDSTKCILCKEETGSGKVAVTRHLSKHLEEISLSALPVEVDSNAASEDGSELSDSTSISHELTGQKNKASANDGSEDLEDKPAFLFDPEDVSTMHPLINAESETPFHQNSEVPDETLLQNALDYIDTVKAQFDDEAGKYETFLETIKSFKDEKVSTMEAVFHFARLCTGYPLVIQGFNNFLPPGYRVEAIDVSKTRVFTPHGGPFIIRGRTFEREKGAQSSSQTDELSSRPANNTSDVEGGYESAKLPWGDLSEDDIDRIKSHIMEKHKQGPEILQTEKRDTAGGLFSSNTDTIDELESFTPKGEPQSDGRVLYHMQGESDPKAGVPFTISAELTEKLRQRQQETTKKWAQQFLDTEDAQVRQMDPQMQDLIHEMARTGKAGGQMMNDNGDDRPITFVPAPYLRRRSQSPPLPSSSFNNRQLTTSDVMYSELNNYGHSVTYSELNNDDHSSDNIAGLQQPQDDLPISKAHDMGSALAENQQMSSVQNDQSSQEPLSPQTRAFEKWKPIADETSLSLHLHPIAGDRPINYMMLFDEVQLRGGYKSVTDAGGWGDVSRALGLLAYISIVAPRLKDLYEQNLLWLEGPRSIRRPSWRQEEQSSDASMPVAKAYWGVTKVRKPDGQHTGACMNCRERNIRCFPDYPQCFRCRVSDRTCTWADSEVKETGTGASGSKDQSDVSSMMRENAENDERRYCYCNNVSYGEMIACDADNCPREWFHLRCVGLEVPLGSSAKWYCKDCKARGKGDTGDDTEDISGTYYLE